MSQYIAKQLIYPRNDFQSFSDIHNSFLRDFPNLLVKNLGQKITQLKKISWLENYSVKAWLKSQFYLV